MTTLQVHVTKRNTVSVQKALFRMGYRWCGSGLTIERGYTNNWIGIHNHNMTLSTRDSRKQHGIPVFIVPEEVVDE